MLRLNVIECYNNQWNLSYVDGLTAMLYLEKLPLLSNPWLNTKAGIWTHDSRQLFNKQLNNADLPIL